MVSIEKRRMEKGRFLLLDSMGGKERAPKGKCLLHHNVGENNAREIE